jgi:hypothetical protein
MCSVSCLKWLPLVWAFIRRENESDCTDFTRPKSRMWTVDGSAKNKHSKDENILDGTAYVAQDHSIFECWYEILLCVSFEWIWPKEPPTASSDGNCMWSKALCPHPFAHSHTQHLISYSRGSTCPQNTTRNIPSRCRNSVEFSQSRNNSQKHDDPTLTNTHLEFHAALTFTGAHVSRDICMEVLLFVLGVIRAVEPVIKFRCFLMPRGYCPRRSDMSSYFLWTKLWCHMKYYGES